MNSSLSAVTIYSRVPIHVDLSSGDQDMQYGSMNDLNNLTVDVVSPDRCGRGKELFRVRAMPLTFTSQPVPSGARPGRQVRRLVMFRRRPRHVRHARSTLPVIVDEFVRTARLPYLTSRVSYWNAFPPIAKNLITFRQDFADESHYNICG